jgi:hypothetical protein
MRFSLTSLVRLIAFVTLGLAAGAVGLSRVVPRVPPHRTMTPPRYFGLNGSTFIPPGSGSYVLDAETGRVERLDLGPGVALDYGTCSPWTDAGGYEIVGRMMNWGPTDMKRADESPLLVRIGMPGREPRGRLALGPLVAGRPCWLPRRPSRLIFPAADGRLYPIDLAERDVATEGTADGSDPGAGPSLSPRPVAWACPMPGEGEPFLADPICPDIPALGGRLFVTLRAVGKDERGEGRRYGPSEIWWLELDASGTSITAAGRLTRPVDRVPPDAGTPGDVPDSRSEDERLPNFTVAPDGRVVLGFLARRFGRPGCRLKVVEVSEGPEGGDPVAFAGKARVVAKACAVATPAFSPDGRWVYAVDQRLAPGPKVERFALLDVLEGAGHAR